MSGGYLVATYVLALGIIAILSIASHIVLDGEVRLNHASAAIVNVSGRQRMYAQRIASLTAQDALGDPVARTDLVVAMNAFESAHRQLLWGDAAAHLPPATADPALREIYFGARYHLDTMIRDFLVAARRCAALPAGDPRIRSVAVPVFALARQPLLDGLNAIVLVHQRESERRLLLLDRIEWAMLCVVLVTLIVEVFAIFQPMVRRINAYARELRSLATTDPLTGVLNRRSFNERGAVEIEKSRRYGRPLTLLMIDADHFKAVNDDYGHDGGDAVLQALTGALAGGMRTSDLLARVGGEEFAILLPETGVSAAQLLAERLRKRVSGLRVTTPAGSVRFTISIGVAAVDAGHATLASAFTSADAALYDAKAGGRDRIATSTAS